MLQVLLLVLRVRRLCVFAFLFLILSHYISCTWWALGNAAHNMDEFDSMEIKLIRRVRLHKRRAELKAMLARDKEPAPRLHEWKAALKAEEAARHEQLEDRAKLKSETTAAKARLKSLSELEDRGQLDSDEETERDELSNSLSRSLRSVELKPLSPELAVGDDGKGDCAA